MLSEHPRLWVPWKNETDTATGAACPPYGCVHILKLEWDGKSLIRRGARPGWAAGKGIATPLANQEAGVYGFNGPKSVGPGKTGVLTVTYPARALYQRPTGLSKFYSDSGDRGQVITNVRDFDCGPVDGQWYVASGDSDLFTLHSLEDVSPIEDTTERIQTIWVQMGQRVPRPEDTINITGPDVEVESGDIAWSTTPSMNNSGFTSGTQIPNQSGGNSPAAKGSFVNSYDSVQAALYTNPFEITNNTLIAPGPGIYHGVFQAQFEHPGTSDFQNDSVGLQLYYVDSNGVEHPTDWRGSEVIQLEDDDNAYGSSSLEPFISVGYQIHLAKGQGLRVRYIGTSDGVTVKNFQMWVARFTKS